MQTSSQPSTTKTTQAIAFLIYLIGGLLIFLWGANTFSLFPSNRNIVYEWGITLIFLTLAVIMQRVPRLQIYWKIASALLHRLSCQCCQPVAGQLSSTDPSSWW